MFKIFNTCCLQKRPVQTVQTQIRLLLKKQSDQGLPCLLFYQAFYESYVNKHLIWEQKVKTVRNFRTFTISGNVVMTSLLSLQGSHRFEKYLNLEGFLENSLKNKSALKSTRKSLKSLEKSWILLFSVGLSTVDRDLNQYKIVVPLFGAAYAALNIGTTILY